MNTQYLILDYETFSQADLKKVGAYEYSMHPSTEILCAAWRLGTIEELDYATTRVWSEDSPGDPIGEFLKALCDPEVKLVAHNAFFETVITKNVFSRYFKSKSEIASIDPNRWICTASMAAALALPRNLEGACLALDLPIKKDMEGRRLMLKMCKPKKVSKYDKRTRRKDPTDFKRLMEYCVKDINAETELFLKLPPLSDNERKVWLLDQKINLRGFEVDRNLVSTTLSLISQEVEILQDCTNELTMGLFNSMTQRKHVLELLGSLDCELPDLRSKTIKDTLNKGEVNETARMVLETRQAISRTSTAKFEAFAKRSEVDGRIRDHMLYHGASTGRWSGMGIQPHNFPRGTIKDTTQAAEIIAKGDLELVRLIYGNPMEVFSSCLRSMIIPSSGKTLFCADYAAIEARVLFWLAKYDAGLDAFRQDRDLYREMAAIIFRVPLVEVTKTMRELGKRAILGCGYGMGPKKFHMTCEAQGQPVEMELAERAVAAYRDVHQPVVKLWKNIERAAMSAVQNKGKKYTINHTKWWVENDFLWCELPSGRKLAYYKPEIRYAPTPWDEKKATLYHYSQNPMTHQWECNGTYGGRLTENVDQAIARDLTAEAVIRIEEAGFDVLMSVHDEILAEKERDSRTEFYLEQFEWLMAENPGWAMDLPIKVEGWYGQRYRK
jgi:DNA polymerase